MGIKPKLKCQVHGFDNHIIIYYAIYRLFCTASAAKRYELVHDLTSNKSRDIKHKIESPNPIQNKAKMQEGILQKIASMRLEHNMIDTAPSLQTPDQQAPDQQAPQTDSTRLISQSM